jgi:hypothetical protein
VGLHGAHGDEEPGTDLGIAAMLPDQGQHLRFPMRDPRPLDWLEIGGRQHERRLGMIESA